MEIQAQKYPFCHRKFSITVIDSALLVQYAQQDVLLETNGVNTLIKALERAKHEIEIYFIALDQSYCRVASFEACLGTFVFKKIRDVSQEVTLKKSLDNLSQKIKALEVSKEGKDKATLCGATLEKKSYITSSTYEPIASIKLPKGNLMLKPMDFNQGQPLVVNSGFYAPCTSHFISHTLRKIHCSRLGVNYSIYDSSQKLDIQTPSEKQSQAQDQ